MIVRGGEKWVCHQYLRRGVSEIASVQFCCCCCCCCYTTIGNNGWNWRHNIASSMLNSSTRDAHTAAALEASSRDHHVTRGSRSRLDLILFIFVHGAVASVGRSVGRGIRDGRRSGDPVVVGVAPLESATVTRARSPGGGGGVYRGRPASSRPGPDRARLIFVVAAAAAAAAETQVI